MSVQVSTTEASGRLGVLSIHLDGERCRIGCTYCYLGNRPKPSLGIGKPATLDPKMLAEAVATLPAREVAVAISEPVHGVPDALKAVVRAANARGLPVAVTTTVAVAEKERGLFGDVDRVNLSIDPAKGPVSVRPLIKLAQDLTTSRREVAFIVTLSNLAFANELAGGLLASMLAGTAPARIQLNGIKPPPDWCNKAYLLGFYGKIQHLIDEHLDRRLYMDCYVHARIFGLGPCPARPDISPANEFRACVYQGPADFTFTTAADLAAKTADYVAPAVCPWGEIV